MSFSPTPTSLSPYADPIRRAPAGGPPWVRLAVVAAILAVSGGARLWQGRRVDLALELGRSSPFPLASLPTTIGPWEGRDATMDPRIVRITGSTDLVTRRYVNRLTGVGLDVLVLYGPAFDVSSHTPEVCYPAAGFEPMPDPADRSIAAGGGSPVLFRSLAFTRGEGGLADSQEVFYSFRHDGRWTSRVAGPRDLLRIPGLFKVQVSRRLAGQERRDVENPCEPFLAALVGEIESRMTGARPAGLTASR